MIISTKILGKRKPPIDDWHYLPPKEITDPGEGGLTLRELLTHIVIDQVRLYNERQNNSLLTQVLSDQQIQAAAATGEVSMGGNEEIQLASEEMAIGTALQAFEDGLYLVFIDETEQSDLDAQVFVNKESKLTFIKLTFLAG